MGPRGQFFRASVGAVLCRDDGSVLAFERARQRGAWQLPQGGLEEGEAPHAAVLREVLEETGIGRDRLALLAEHPRLLAYELPEEARTEKTGRGQVQYWFYFACGSAPALPSDGEFRAWRWTRLDTLAAEVVAFRRPVYRELLAHFEAAVRPTR